MNKKYILIGVGILAVAGIGFYFWNKSKNATNSEVAEGGTEGNGETSADSTTKSSTPTSTSSSTPSATPTSTPSATPKPVLETRKDKRKACGRKPILKKKKEEWQKCIDAGGVASFEGVSEMYEQNMIREKSFAEQVINREDGRMFAGNVYEN